MPPAPHDARLRNDQTPAGRSPGRSMNPTDPRRTRAILCFGLGPMVGALVDAVEAFDPHEPIPFPSTAATHLREFQYRVRDFRVSELIDALNGAYCKQNPRG